MVDLAAGTEVHALLLTEASRCTLILCQLFVLRAGTKEETPLRKR